VIDEEKFKAAMWAGDVDMLHELSPCGCCCGEHTHLYCQAREWGGCRSGLMPGESADEDAYEWQRWYAEIRGMTEAEFFGTYGGSEDGQADRE